MTSDCSNPCPKFWRSEDLMDVYYYKLMRASQRQGCMGEPLIYIRVPHCVHSSFESFSYYYNHTLLCNNSWIHTRNHCIYVDCTQARWQWKLHLKLILVLLMIPYSASSWNSVINDDQTPGKEEKEQEHNLLVFSPFAPLYTSHWFSWGLYRRHPRQNWSYVLKSSSLSCN